MKNSLLFIAFMTVVLSLYTTRIYGSLSCLDVPGSEAASLFEPSPSPPECEYTIFGDANEDGQVNVLDVIAMVSYIMGGSPDPFDLEATDMNADGIINILDVISVTSLILQTPGMQCPGTPAVSYGGKTYSTVLIGDQCWFRENLNVGNMIAGTIEQSNNGTIEKYCYGNILANCNSYGGLYQWPEAMKYQGTAGAQGICPTGWHLPTDMDYTVLTTFLGGAGEAGGRMKEAGLTPEPRTPADSLPLQEDTASAPMVRLRAWGNMAFSGPPPLPTLPVAGTVICTIPPTMRREAAPRRETASR